MDAIELIEKLAGSFEKFMAEAQLSSAISIVIDDGVLSEVSTGQPVLQKGLAAFIKQLQNLHDALGLASSEESADRTACWTCRQEKQSKAVVEIDPSVIQITADNKEIDKRIRAFIERKQVEKDDTNRREFCVAATQATEATCARTDAIFSSNMGGRSHVKVSKVVNKYGPQTRPALVTMPLIRPGMKRSRTPPDSSSGTAHSAAGVEERLYNMESYLKIKPGQNSSPDVFQRLKALEDRILHLESISPEYSHISSSMSKQQRGDSGGRTPGGDSTVQDIDNRIKELQRSLRMKKARMETEPAAPQKMDF